MCVPNHFHRLSSVCVSVCVCVCMQMYRVCDVVVDSFPHEYVRVFCKRQCSTRDYDIVDGECKRLRPWQLNVSISQRTACFLELTYQRFLVTCPQQRHTSNLQVHRAATDASCSTPPPPAEVETPSSVVVVEKTMNASGKVSTIATMVVSSTTRLTS